jgi:hypothetical protein
MTEPRSEKDYPNSGRAFEVDTPKFEGQFLSGSDFNTDCPHCGARTNWFLDVYKKASSKGGWWYIVKLKAKRDQGTQSVRQPTHQTSMPLEPAKKPTPKWDEKPIDDEIPF